MAPCWTAEYAPRNISQTCPICLYKITSGSNIIYHIQGGEKHPFHFDCFSSLPQSMKTHCIVCRRSSTTDKFKTVIFKIIKEGLLVTVMTFVASLAGDLPVDVFNLVEKIGNIQAATFSSLVTALLSIGTYKIYKKIYLGDYIANSFIFSSFLLKIILNANLYFGYSVKQSVILGTVGGLFFKTIYEKVF